MQFKDFIGKVLKFEGGFQDHPNDIGNFHPDSKELIGTNFGIAARYYPEEDIRGMTAERAAEIYEDDFYNATRIKMLPPHLRFTVFDMGINAGSWRAVVGLQMISQFPDPTAKQMQRCVDVMLRRERPGKINLLAIDGAIGPRTAAAAFVVTLEDYTRLREAYYTEVAKLRDGANQVFLHGWLKRARQAHKFTITLLQRDADARAAAKKS